MTTILKMVIWSGQLCIMPAKKLLIQLQDTRPISYQRRYIVPNAGPNSLSPSCPRGNDLTSITRWDYIIPSDNLSSVACSIFAQVNFIETNCIKKILKPSLNEFRPNLAIFCDKHKLNKHRGIIKMVFNTFSTICKNSLEILPARKELQVSNTAHAQRNRELRSYYRRFI